MSDIEGAGVEPAVVEVAERKQESEFSLFYPSKHYNQATVLSILPDEIRFSFWNHKQIWLDFQDAAEGEHDWRGRRGYDLKDLEDTQKGPAIILGSGPGLDEALPMLKDWKGGLICSTSHTNTLAYHGVRPTHIIYSDVRCRWEEIDGVPPNWWEEAQNTAQVIYPGTHPDVIAKWPQRTYYYLPRDPAIPLYWDIWPKAYDFIKMALLPFACSPAAELGIGRAIGYNPIFMLGHNFGYTHDGDGGLPARYRFLGYNYRDGAWKAETPAAAPAPETVVMSENGYPSTAINLFYKRAMFCVARLECHREDPLQLISATPYSTITEFPYMSPEEMIASGGQVPEAMRRTTEEQMWSCERYLARVGSYCVRFKRGGVRFADMSEPARWREFLTAYMMKVNRDTGQEAVDIEANLARFEQLHEENRTDGIPRPYSVRPTEKYHP